MSEQYPEKEREFLAITEKEIFEEARDRLQIAIDAEQDDRDHAKEDLKFAEGDQWDHDVVTTSSMETPELTINLTDALVKRVVNNMKQQRPRGKCHPVGDGAQIEISDVINGIGRHVEYRSEASVAYDTAGEMAVRAGWGYCRLVAEYVAENSFDQDLRILPIRNLFTVYCDPGAIMPTACDANWILITIKMKRTEYKRLYPRMDNVAWNDVGRDEWRVDWEDKEEIRLAEYFRIRERSDKLYLLKDQSGNEFTRFKDEMPSPESLQAAGLTVDDERESSRRQVEWFRLNGTRVVDRKILPGTFIPVFRCEGNAVDVDGKVMRRGMVRAMADPQRMVNYGEVAKIRRLGLTPQAPWVAAEGQLDGHPEWENSNQQPYSVLTYKPITVMTAQGEQVLPPPVRQPPAQLEQGFAEFTQGMRSNLLAVAGMPHEPGQDAANGQVVSGVAQKRREMISDQSHYQYYDNLTLMIAQVWRVMLEYIPVIYSKERMQRIIGEDGVPEMVGINQPVQEDGVSKVKNDITVGRYDVVMDTGPGYETKREEGAENLVELLKIQPFAEVIAKIGMDLVFRAQDHPYMQELADRLAAQTPQGLEKVMSQLPERAKSLVQSMAAQIQQMQQALQQAQLENKYKMAAHQLAAETKVHDTQVRAVTARHDTLIKADTAVKVAEINKGAELIKEKMVHGHEDRAAEREMVHEAEEAERGRAHESGEAERDRQHTSAESAEDRKIAKARPANGK